MAHSSNAKIIVFESPDFKDSFFIYFLLKCRYRVAVVEPFHTYHHKNHRKGFCFYPPHLPFYIWNLIRRNHIQLIRAEQLDAHEIYHIAADMSVGAIEAVFSFHKECNKEICSYVSQTLKSEESEKAFKINFCNRLAEFYSMNIMLHRIGKLFEGQKIIFCSDGEVGSYVYLKDIMIRSNQEVYSCPSIQFSVYYHAMSFMRKIRRDRKSVV